jgi:uncharacterized membrane protein YhaH (DUF805 family)
MPTCLRVLGFGTASFLCRAFGIRQSLRRWLSPATVVSFVMRCVHVLIFDIVVFLLQMLGIFVFLSSRTVSLRNNSFTPIGGLTAIVFGLLVVVRQLIPEHSIGPSAFNIRAKYVPLLALTVAITGAVARVTHVGTLLYALCGFQLGWVYLRYFQRRENGYGDRSDAFSYDAFFPEPIARPVRVVAAVVFIIFRPLLLSAQSVDLEDKSMSGVASAIDSVDAERHRQRALKALDERLNTAKSGSEDLPV